MTPEKNNGLKINLKTVAVILGLVISILAIFSYYNSSLSSRIANHPKIIRMENGIEQTQKDIGEIKQSLNEMNKKLDDIRKEK